MLMFLHTAVHVYYVHMWRLYHTAVLSSENIGIEYYQIGISSATSIVLHA